MYFRASNGSVSDTETLTVSVLNVNDNTPTFNPEIYYTTIAENTAQGELLCFKYELKEKMQ